MPPDQIGAVPNGPARRFMALAYSVPISVDSPAWSGGIHCFAGLGFNWFLPETVTP